MFELTIFKSHLGGGGNGELFLKGVEFVRHNEKVLEIVVVIIQYCD